MGEYDYHTEHDYDFVRFCEIKLFTSDLGIPQIGQLPWIRARATMCSIWVGFCPASSAIVHICTIHSMHEHICLENSSKIISETDWWMLQFHGVMYMVKYIAQLVQPLYEKTKNLYSTILGFSFYIVYLQGFISDSMQS